MLPALCLLALTLGANEYSRLDDPTIIPFSDSGWGYTLDVPRDMHYVLFQVEHLAQFINEDEETELIVDVNVVEEDIGIWDIYPMPPGYEGQLTESRDLTPEELLHHHAYKGHRADYIVPTPTAVAGISILMMQIQWTVFTVTFTYPMEKSGILNLVDKTLDSFILIPGTYYYNYP